MKYTTYHEVALLLTFILYSTPGVEAQNWNSKNPFPTSTILRQVKTLSPGISVIAGDLGNVLMTTDGGSTWHSQVFNSMESPMRLTFTDPVTWWVVGTGGLIAKTTDGGQSWTVLMHDVMLPTLYDAYFRDPQHGLVVGQKTIVSGNTVSMAPVFLRTSDGGASWSTTYSSAGNLTSLFFLTHDAGWASTGSQFVRTTDGGATWTAAPTPPAGGLQAPVFFDTRKGICWGSAWNGSQNITRMFVTADSGNSWTSAGDTNLFMKPPHIVSEHDIWAADVSTVLHSTDGGASWTTAFVSYDDEFEDVTADGANIIAAGTNGRIWESTDSGHTWSPKFKGPRNSIRAIAFTDSTGWAVGGGTAWANHPLGSILLRSRDRGEHWDSLACPTPSYLYSVSFADYNTGWVGGPGGLILKTTDGGMSWNAQPNNSAGIITQIRFLDAQNGWAVSYDGLIQWTTNGGQAWETASTDLPSASMADIWMNDLKHGFAVGASKTLLRTSDGGISWTGVRIGTPMTFDFLGVCFTDAQTGFVAASGSYMLRTSDGGDSWYFMNMGLGQSFLSVAFTGADTGFAVGNLGTMVMTTDGGISWGAQSPGSWNSLFRVASFPGLGAWMVGENGAILHYVPSVQRSTTAIQTNPTVPSSVSMYQNYPNPFNPATTIRYGLPARANVTVQVFNTLGQQIAVLVNESQEAGYHEVRFDGTGLASGVYIYRLRAGEYTATMKSLLVK